MYCTTIGKNSGVILTWDDTGIMVIPILARRAT